MQWRWSPDSGPAAGARATGQMLLRKASALSLICYLNPCSYSPPPSFQGSIMAVWLDCLTVDWLDMTMLFENLGSIVQLVMRTTKVGIT